MIKVTFDGTAKRINVNVGVTELDIKEDVYSDWKVWASEADNLKYLSAFRTVGGDPIVGGKFLGSTYFLINGWKIHTADWNHVLTINGNLYSEDGSSPFVNSTTSSVTVIQQVSNLLDSQVIETEISQNLEYNGIVYVDINSTNTGITYPNGTIAQAVNNFPDAIIIANRIGTRRLCLSGDAVISTDISGFHIKGFGANHTLEFQAGAGTLNSQFEHLTVTGILDGKVDMYDCTVYNASGLSGSIRNSMILGKLYPANGDLALHLCYSGISGPMAPSIDFSGATNANVSIRAYSGGLKIENCASPSNITTVEYIAGNFILNNTNSAGDITVRGSASIGQNYNNLANTDATVSVKGIWDYDVSQSETNSIGKYIKDKLLSVSKFIGLS